MIVIRVALEVKAEEKAAFLTHMLGDYTTSC